MRTRRARWTSFAVAGPGERVAAFVADAGIFWVVWVAGVILLIETGELGSVPRLASPRTLAWAGVVAAMWWAYDGLSLSRWGSTAGRRILDIEVRDGGGDLLSTRAALRRTVARTGGVVALGAGVAPIWTRVDRKGLHDRLVGSVVVRTGQLEPAGDGPGGMMIGAVAAADATEVAIRGAATGPAEAGWLRAIAEQTIARLDVAAPSWRVGPEPELTRDRTFCLLLAALVARYPEHRALLVAVLDHHVVLDELGRGRLPHLQDLLDDAARARRWLELPTTANIAVLVDTTTRPREDRHQVGARDRR